jgi:hypothetical protein
LGFSLSDACPDPIGIGGEGWGEEATIQSLRFIFEMNPYLTTRVMKLKIFNFQFSIFNFFAFLALSPLPLSTAAQTPDVSSPLQWPLPTRENHPWTRWWWLGSAVDETNLSRLLVQYQRAGLGGVEICPIYGAKGYEEHFIDFLSPEWMRMLAYTTKEAQRLNLGVDLTTGTGWPFGGPNVTPEIASAKVILKRYDVTDGHFKGELPEGRVQCVRAVSDKDEQIDLTSKVSGRQLDWTAPRGQWHIYAVLAVSPAQRVKRAAPGGDGSVLDPYSVKALDQYLARFDQAFTNYHAPMPRSQFHDSFEYYGAQWTPSLFKEFERRRGYDLREELPAFFGEGPDDKVARVRCDYRETISDLHLAYIERWTAWCHAHGCLSRDQAHGSPGNLVDIYAAADIPETEIFGAPEESHMAMNKFSSSAAHLANRRFASSESFTWLTEHFQASLSEIKQAADYLLLSGVNHIFYHGIPYSPSDAPWPGWQFYAAVNFGPQGGLWHDLPEFNAYITRCQSILQTGSPDNDVLLYYPIYDVWNSTGELIRPNPVPKSLTNTVTRLWEHGYAFDYLSDRFLSKLECNRGKLIVNSNAYAVIVVPECQFIPNDSFEKLTEVAGQGATVVFQNHLPSDVPGWANLNSREKSFKRGLNRIHFEKETENGTRGAKIGRGLFLVGTNLEAMLAKTAAKHESSAESGLRFLRRKSSNGFNYFFANRSQHAFDDWVTLPQPFYSAVIMDPRFIVRTGAAATRNEISESGKDTPKPDSARYEIDPLGVQSQFYLQLQPGESCLVRVFTNKVVAGRDWAYTREGVQSNELIGKWNLKFIDGGPSLPESRTMPSLTSWTEAADPEGKRFSGTALYTLGFNRPDDRADDWILDLGTLYDSARVRLNGREVGGFAFAPFRENVGAYLRPGRNVLDIEITNLAANRIADLDRRKVKWKYFYDINVASKRYRSLDASDWPVRPSGLLGPVRLIPLKRFDPAHS